MEVYVSVSQRGNPLHYVARKFHGQRESLKIRQGICPGGNNPEGWTRRIRFVLRKLSLGRQSPQSKERPWTRSILFIFIIISWFSWFNRILLPSKMIFSTFLAYVIAHWIFEIICFLAINIAEHQSKATFFSWTYLVIAASSSRLLMSV